jgi:hypothetical protein
MLTTRHNRGAICFYWIGVAASVACVAVVLARDSSLFWRWEHRGMPLSGVLAGAAAIAFLVAELCDALYGPGESQQQESLPALHMEQAPQGKVSKEEFLQFMEAAFDRLDKEKRGELDASKLRLRS